MSSNRVCNSPSSTLPMTHRGRRRNHQVTTCGSSTRKRSCDQPRRGPTNRELEPWKVDHGPRYGFNRMDRGQSHATVEKSNACLGVENLDEDVSFPPQCFLFHDPNHPSSFTKTRTRPHGTRNCNTRPPKSCQTRLPRVHRRISMSCILVGLLHRHFRELPFLDVRTVWAMRSVSPCNEVHPCCAIDFGKDLPSGPMDKVRSCRGIQRTWSIQLGRRKERVGCIVCEWDDAFTLLPCPCVFDVMG